MNKWTQCRNCRNKNPPGTPPGFISQISEIDSLEYKTVTECFCHKSWRLKNEAYKRFINNGFDLFDINMRGDDDGDYKGNKSIGNILRLKNYIEKFQEDQQDIKKAILYFYGPPDTQKTATANWIANRLIWKYDIRYIDFNIFFKMYIDYEYLDKKEGSEIEKKIKDLEECDLLVFDNFFNEKGEKLSDKQSPFLERFLTTRISSNKGIIFISHNSLSNLKNDNIKNLINKEVRKINSELFFEDNFHDVPEDIF